MVRLEIIPAQLYHCGRMARLLRRDHRLAIERLGINVHHALRDAFHASYVKHACTIDGELAALGGVTGSALSPFGIVWLALTEHGARFPVAIVKQARRMLDELATNKIELNTTVLDEDETAQRFAAFLGFHVSDEEPGRRAYSKWARRQLLEFMRRDPDSRVIQDNGFMYRMGYHTEAP